MPGQGQPPLLIEAERGTHDTGIPDLLALSLPGGTLEEINLHDVILLLPNGETLESTGSYSGIQERGFWNKKRKTKKAKKRSNIFRKVASGYKRATKSPAFKNIAGKARKSTKAVGGGLKKGWTSTKWAAGQAGKGVAKGAQATWKGTKWVGKQIGKGGLIAAKAVCQSGLWTAKQAAKGYELTIGKATKELAKLLKVDKTQKAMRKAIDRIKERNGEAIRRTIEASLILTDPKNSKAAKDLMNPNKMCDRPGKTIQKTFQNPLSRFVIA